MGPIRGKLFEWVQLKTNPQLLVKIFWIGQATEAVQPLPLERCPNVNSKICFHRLVSKCSLYVLTCTSDLPILRLCLEYKAYSLVFQINEYKQYAFCKKKFKFLAKTGVGFWIVRNSCIFSGLTNTF